MSFTAPMTFGAALSDGVNPLVSCVHRESPPQTRGSNLQLHSWIFLCFPTVYLRFILSVHSSLASALLILIVIQVKLAKTKQLCLQSDSIYQCSAPLHLILTWIGVVLVCCRGAGAFAEWLGGMCG